MLRGMAGQCPSMLDQETFDALTFGATVLASDAGGIRSLRLADGTRLDFRRPGPSEILACLWQRWCGVPPTGDRQMVEIPGLGLCMLHFHQPEGIPVAPEEQERERRPVMMAVSKSAERDSGT